jgi:hypothetical protein
MLQDMDTMEASCVCCVKVRMFTHLEESIMSHVTFNTQGIVRLTVQHDLIINVNFIYVPWDALSSTSEDIRSMEQCPIHTRLSSVLGCLTP